ncbi:MAG TPA: class D sortase [Thermoanaerobaculia bacterium]
MTTRAASWLRRAEIVLWLIGLCLLAAALAAGVHRWSYQEQQERALAHHAPRAQEPSRAGGEIARPLALEVASPARREAGETPAPREADAASIERDLQLDPDVIGRIEIPRLGLEAIVREGDDEETLDRAVGFIPGTARPGAGGNTALAGHRDTFFRPLRRIEVGDVIRLEVPGETYAYRVAETRVVDPGEVSVLESRGTEELTLLTCYPFRWIGPAPERFVVRATRIP